MTNCLSLPLSQRYPEWAGEMLGYDPTQTLGMSGCLFFCLLKMVTWGQAWSRKYVESFMGCLKGHGNYTPAGGALLQSFDVSACIPPSWGTLTVINPNAAAYSGPFPQSELDALTKHLSTVNNFSILEVDPTPGTPGIGPGDTHFVLATGLWESHISIYDPWYGDYASLTPRYGPDAATALYRAVNYVLTPAGGA